MASERELAALAVALGALDVPGVSAPERALARGAAAGDREVRAARDEIRAGGDPLGAAFCALRPTRDRRTMGATYTPQPIVDAMIAWAKTKGRLARVVDPGAGSGRFVVAAGRAFSRARLLAIELDPLAALIARAHLAAAGLARRAEVRVGDYRDARIPPCDGTTLYVGNPPYVRHHLIDPRWKRWLTRLAARRELRASQLAGLHVHFFLATVLHAAPGDRGAFITAAEWLDVNYGALPRELFLGPLGGEAIHVIEPTAAPFPDAQATAAITCFEIGARPPAARLRRVSGLASLGDLRGGRAVPRERLAAAPRWTPLTRATRRAPPGYVQLGELCRVRRGQVTGANGFWIAGEHAAHLPRSVLFPAVTRASELFSAGHTLGDAAALRCVIDLPGDLDRFDEDDRRAIDALLARARAAGIDKGYVARHREPWWSVGLYEPAPILATYMARRAPAFVRNPRGARNLNIAHGLYPRGRLDDGQLDALATYLSRSVAVSSGRTYAGGLTKFEPREMERLLVPVP